MTDENIAQSPVATTTEPERVVFKVGENSVYNSVDSLYKGAVEKEEYISKMRDELSSLKGELERLRNTASVKDELKEMKELFSKKAESDASNTKASMLDEAAIEALAMKAFTKKQAEESLSRNANESTEVLNRAFGKDAQAVFSNKAKELGIAESELHAIAAKSPKAFKSLMGISGENKVPLDTLTSSSKLSTFVQDKTDTEQPAWKQKLSATKKKGSLLTEKEIQEIYKSYFNKN